MRNLKDVDTLPAPERISDTNISVVVPKLIHEALWKFVMVLPKCDVCNKISTRKGNKKGSKSYGYSCDLHDHEKYYEDWISEDISWSEPVRSLYEALKESNFKSVEEAASLMFLREKK